MLLESQTWNAEFAASHIYYPGKAYLYGSRIGQFYVLLSEQKIQ